MQNDFRTPLSRVRGLGSAKEGTQHFWHQRLTAMANLPLTLFFVWIVASSAWSGYEATLATLGSPLVTILMLLTLGSAIYHMKLGMQVVIEDYVHGAAGKALLIANTFFCIALAATCGFALLKIGFGG